VKTTSFAGNNKIERFDHPNGDWTEYEYRDGNMVRYENSKGFAEIGWKK
jgi:hypothetical protein